MAASDRFYCKCYCIPAGDEDFDSEESEDGEPGHVSFPVTNRGTPRIYETEAKEPDLSKQPKKSALKVRIGDSSSVYDSDSLKRQQTPPPPPEPPQTDSSPKATPVKPGPPKPMPRVTLLR